MVKTDEPLLSAEFAQKSSDSLGAAPPQFLCANLVKKSFEDRPIIELDLNYEVLPKIYRNCQEFRNIKVASSRISNPDSLGLM